MKGNINSIETMGAVDGPGLRIVFFLQGCPLRCIFCHNPETWNEKENILMTPSEVLEKIIRYKNYFGTNGGVTFSGGEPLYQPEFLLEVLKLCKKNNIDTTIDTSGVNNNRGLKEEILKYTDLVIMDIKGIDVNNYKEITSKKITESLEFIDLCQKLNKKMWLRQVIVPGINDNEEYILKLKKFIEPLKNIDKVELLPYHTLGLEKYKKLGIKYKLDKVNDMDIDRCKKLEQILNNR